ncbi:MAG TPA: isoleucine--tRNA ligase [Nitratifractor sp.]|nr:isoleucine--tRNA ligase [Nitratifractor sp.]HHH20893.1 isoleucine--tRNA ligase [Nitratifractor sp.]
MDYKDTILLPKTSFPMRGNLPKNEPLRYSKWFEEGVYEKMKSRRQGREMFTLHDGPPYANGDIHIGHALNKTLKDIIVKYHYFQGKAVRYTPGWDCHGLPIEQKVEEKIGKEKKDALSVAKFRELCRAHATKFVEHQKEGFKSLGIIGDWENPYLTMDFKFEANIFRALCQVANRGLLVERSKPIYWSWAAQTALADAEIEYKDKEDYSLYVAFELSESAKKELGVDGKAALVIWTTTPWTLPANVAIALHPEEDYVLTKEGYIVAKSRLDALVQEGVLQSSEIVKEFSSKELEHKKAVNALNGRESYIILGDFVELDGGTGAVHSAPGHGEVDYFASLKYNLDVLMPVDDHGLYDESVVGLGLLPNPEEFVGMHVFKANEKIVELLGESVLSVSRFTHSYPFCWRTKKPVIYRATKQWFIAVDKEMPNHKTLRQSALDAIKDVKFYPAWGKNRFTPMIEGRPDWCISRQRSWGVPIAFFRVKATKEVILDEKVLNFVAMIFEHRGCDAWYDMPISELLYPGSGYKPEELEKITDVLDVWFDSGSTWYATLKSRNYDAGEYPADLYLEGTDQHRGWFQSSMLVSCGINDIAPYKGLLTHGFTVDEKGEKMSKSKGNVVAPQEVTKEFGSEILRLWVALSDYQSDLKISKNILKQTAEQYRKIRNSFRFLLANLDGLEEVLEVEHFGELDRWILAKAKSVFDEVNSEFAKYEFARAFSLLNSFLTNELSGIYMDLCKDRLYCDAKESLNRRGAQSAMYLIAKSMLALVAPVLTYTADEAIEHAPAIFKKDLSDIFDLEYQPLPEVESSLNSELLINARESFFEAIDKLKKEKVIRTTLELAIVGDSALFGMQEAKNLEDWFGVSAFETSSEQEVLAEFTIEGNSYSIVRASGYKCPRCWRFTSEAEDKLCSRCSEVLA